MGGCEYLLFVRGDQYRQVIHRFTCELQRWTSALFFECQGASGCYPQSAENTHCLRLWLDASPYGTQEHGTIRLASYPPPGFGNGITKSLPNASDRQQRSYTDNLVSFLVGAWDRDRIGEWSDGVCVACLTHARSLEEWIAERFGNPLHPCFE